MIAFHKHLPENIDIDDITLKYNLRDTESTPAWVGLVTARESGEIWQRILSKGSLDPEIGVFVTTHSIVQQDIAEVAENFSPSDPRPKMSIYVSNNGGWSTTPLGDITTPATYKVRNIRTHFRVHALTLPQELLQQACLRFKKHGVPPPPADITLTELEKRVQIKIRDCAESEWRDLKPSGYKSAVNRYVSGSVASGWVGIYVGIL